MTTHLDNNETVEDFSQVPIINEDGLMVTFNDKECELTFLWDPDTHPQWNYLEEIDKDVLIQKIVEFVNNEVQ